MAVIWTDEQLKAITLKDRNLLVSASAGSGKTTVLVERILRRISEGEAPTDIDRLLVVTFTRAAAAEMRSRIYASISKKLKERPDDRHLRRQLTLLNRAQICTIDSFCSTILKNYYQEISLDPSFRVGDQAEMTLLKEDTLKAVLEQEYAQGTEAFLDFSENFAYGKSDDALMDRILKLYDFSQSAPYPDRWLEEALENFRAEDEETFLSGKWAQHYTVSLKEGMQECAAAAAEIADCCVRNAYSQKLTEQMTEEAEMLRKAADFSDLREAQEKSLQVSFPRYPGKQKAIDEEERIEIRAMRDSYIDSAKDLVKELRGSAVDEALEINRGLLKDAEEYVRVTRIFSEAFSEAKRERGLIDYSDLEHMAISILLKDGEPTETARTLAESFDEILIDEYQDSNFVQEEILTAVSRRYRGENNIFMVGDMKQSIYRFRMARPELFTSKYDSYSREEASEQLVELPTNYRSGEPVISAVNFLFKELMQRPVGAIEYDDNACLKIGPQAETETEKNARFDRSTQILLYRDYSVPKEEGQEEKEESEEITDTEAADAVESSLQGEAMMVAAEIERLLADPEKHRIYDNDLKDYRPLSPGDVVILLRASRNTDVVFSDALEAKGIPVSLENREGYFRTLEVRLVLDLLRIINNPIQDIPLAAVMHSALYDFSASELARITASYVKREEGNGLYGAVLSYRSQGDIPALREKIDAFLKDVEKYRSLSFRSDISGLLRRIYREKQLDTFFAAMPGGEQRERNLAALLNRAADFEKTSYHGIFHFIRFIEKLQKSEVDLGEPGSAGSSDAVRIMTIHKSKGLEFPVVFVSGLGKKLNTQDTQAAVIYHASDGFAFDLVDHRTRVKRKSLMKKALAQAVKTEGMGEELRILYVALTRAREKLYMTGVLKAPGKNKPAFIPEEKTAPAKRPSPSEISGAASPMDWILRVWYRDCGIGLRTVEEEDLLKSEVKEVLEKAEKELTLESFMLEQTEKSRRAMEDADRVFSASYLYDGLHSLRPSLSVSALKMEHISMAEEASSGVFDRPEALVNDIPEEDRERLKRKYAGKSGDGAWSNGGAALGTLYHFIMERMDPYEDAEEAVLRLAKEGLISDGEQDKINEDKIRLFWNSSVGKRFRAAFDKGLGFREKSFIVGLPAAELRKNVQLVRSPGELLMLQGIIDMYFEEDGELVIVDYKTDRVKTAEELKDRYQLQLELYGKALEQITGKKVREKIIYSFSLGEEIWL